MKKIIPILIVIIFVFSFTAFLNSAVKIKKARVYPVEKKHIGFFYSFCRKNRIAVRAMPIITSKVRNFLVYIISPANMPNFLLAVKLVASKYLLPLLRSLTHSRNQKVGYYSIFIYIKDKKRLLTSIIRPNDAIMYAAGEITDRQLYRRVIVKYTNP